mmetsp:Transcript_8441/g.20688  ORF Transcript_8441/g.20688 Transcript_8441/m.20688 type:complete len:197 (-) Transcript_8441:1091-1681(-)
MLSRDTGYAEIAEKVLIPEDAEGAALVLLDADSPNGCDSMFFNSDYLQWWLTDLGPGSNSTAAATTAAPKKEEGGEEEEAPEPCTGKVVNLGPAEHRWHGCEILAYEKPSPSHGAHRYEFFLVPKSVVKKMPKKPTWRKNAKSFFDAVRDPSQLNIPPALTFFVCGYDAARQCELDQFPEACVKNLKRFKTTKARA